MIYLQLFFIFTYVSLVGFGGGTAMIPIFEKLLVPQWTSLEEFMNIVALSQATPGAFSINLATYVGYISSPAHRYFGAFIATLGHSVFSFFMCIGVGKFLKKHEGLPIVQAIFNALKPISTALLVWSIFIILKVGGTTDTSLYQKIGFFLIFILSFFLLKIKNKKGGAFLSPIFVIFLGGFLGILINLFYSFFTK